MLLKPLCLWSLLLLLQEQEANVRDIQRWEAQTLILGLRTMKLFSWGDTDAVLESGEWPQ